MSPVKQASFKLEVKPLEQTPTFIPDKLDDNKPVIMQIKTDDQSEETVFEEQKSIIVEPITPQAASVGETK